MYRHLVPAAIAYLVSVLVGDTVQTTLLSESLGTCAGVAAEFSIKELARREAEKAGLPETVASCTALVAGIVAFLIAKFVTKHCVRQELDRSSVVSVQR